MGGRGKHRIGRIHKNSEKKRQAQKVNKVGRPRKVRLPTIEDLDMLDEVISSSLSDMWSRHSHDDYKEYIKLSPQGVGGCMAITHSLRVYNNLTWSLSVHGMEINKSTCVPLKCIKDKLDEEL